MKKTHLLLGALVLILSSCGSPIKNSSTEASSSASSSSSSSSISTRTSSSSILTVPAIVSYVANLASKYNDNRTAEAIMTEAGLVESSSSTEGSLVRTLKAAFDGFMPTLTGQRKYGGVYVLPTITGTITDKTKSALNWLVSYGLWGEEAFEENKTVDEAFLETMMQRFYMYFGSEKKDDFFAYVNHDFLYEDPGDQSITPDDDYRRILILNGENVQSNVLQYIKDRISAEDDDAILYQQALDYYAGTLDYSFLDDPVVKTEIGNIESISSLSDWTSCSATALERYGQSGLADNFNFSLDVNEKGERGSAYGVVDPASNWNYLLAKSYPEADTISAATTAFTELGIIDPESWATSYSNFAKAHREKYLSSEFEPIKYVKYPLYDASTKKDLFESQGIDIDLTSLFTTGGYTLEEMALCKTSMAGSYLSYGKTLEEASVDELRAVALWEYHEANKAVLSYKKGTAGSYDNLLTLIQNNLAADYMASSYYEGSLETLATLFSDIQRIFAKRVDASSWLSSEGKAAVKEKLAAVKSNLIGTSNDGTTIPYSGLSTKKGLTLAASFGNAKAQFGLCLIKRALQGNLNLGIVALINMGPFLVNAFYLQGMNSINITFGAIFSLGLELSAYSEETILAKIGFVLGHEVTHGFDGEGVNFDKNGNYLENAIIPTADMEKFSALNLEAEKIYEGQEVLPGLAQDPHVTITEDVADMGGFAIMEDLGKEKVGFDFKLFYEEQAGGFASKITRSRFIANNLKNVHPYGRVRCNVLLANSGLFQQTFDLEEGDGMYRASDKRVVIW